MQGAKIEEEDKIKNIGMKRVLLLGSGGREHAFAHSMAKSKKLEKLYIAPGNGGTMSEGENISLDIKNFKEVKQFVLDNAINMVVVGPEEPLVLGITDFFKNDSEVSQIPVIGPSLEGAKLEGSKDYAKAFMMRHNIPTAAYQTFTLATIEEGCSFIDTLKPPYVLKADGLAAGKGVLILESSDEAKSELRDMLSGKFGTASSSVVIEEYLHGIEMSVFVLTDGANYKILPEAKDYKRIGEGDTGLNTGGMGAVSPVPFADADFMDKVRTRIVEPTVNGFAQDNIEYKGFVFIGLMNVEGNPFVIEYNVRMGDPETEVVLPRIESDLVELFDAVSKEQLNDIELKISPDYAVTVVCVAGGYPGDYVKGMEITGLDSVKDSFVYHAGTKSVDGKIYSNGGRVLAVTSRGATLKEAVDKSYNTISGINFDGIYYRKDISKDLQ